MKLDRVVFRYITDTNARFQAMKAGEGQVMEPQAQLQIADFAKDPNFVVKPDRRVLVRAPRHPVRPEGCLLRSRPPFVRQALITGINRPQIAGALYSDDRSRPAPRFRATSSRPSRRATPRPYARFPLQPDEGHHHAQGQGLHRRA